MAEMQFIAPIIGVFLALLLFMTLLLAGSWLLRLLGLEPDPTELQRWAPAPSPLQGHPVQPEQARARGAARRALMPRYRQAAEAWGLWASLQEVFYSLDPSVTSQLPDWQERAERIHQELEALVPRLASEVGNLDQICASLQALEEEVAAQLPPASARRLWLMLLLALLLLPLLFLLWTLP